MDKCRICLGRLITGVIANVRNGPNRDITIKGEALISPARAASPFIPFAKSARASGEERT